MKKSALLAVALPILALGSWVGKLGFVRSTGVELVFPVTGYDPRDLLSGHYLQYQIVYGIPTTCPSYGESNYCHCLERGEGAHAKSRWFGLCGEAPTDQCELRLKGQCRHGRFLAGVERFYLSEELGAKVRVPNEGATVTLRLSSDGHAQATDFRIQGQTLREWADHAPVNP